MNTSTGSTARAQVCPSFSAPPALVRPSTGSQQPTQSRRLSVQTVDPDVPAPIPTGQPRTVPLPRQSLGSKLPDRPARPGSRHASPPLSPDSGHLSTAALLARRPKPPRPRRRVQASAAPSCARPAAAGRGLPAGRGGGDSGEAEREGTVARRQATDADGAREAGQGKCAVHYGTAGVENGAENGTDTVCRCAAARDREGGDDQDRNSSICGRGEKDSGRVAGSGKHRCDKARRICPCLDHANDADGVVEPALQPSLASPTPTHTSHVRVSARDVRAAERDWAASPCIEGLRGLRDALRPFRSQSASTVSTPLTKTDPEQVAVVAANGASRGASRPRSRGQKRAAHHRHGASPGKAASPTDLDPGHGLDLLVRDAWAGVPPRVAIDNRGHMRACRQAEWRARAAAGEVPAPRPGFREPLVSRGAARGAPFGDAHPLASHALAAGDGSAWGPETVPPADVWAETGLPLPRRFLDARLAVRARRPGALTGDLYGDRRKTADGVQKALMAEEGVTDGAAAGELRAAGREAHARRVAAARRAVEAFDLSDLAESIRERRDAWQAKAEARAADRFNAMFRVGDRPLRQSWERGSADR